MDADKKFNELIQMRDLFEKLDCFNGSDFSKITERLETCFRPFISGNDSKTYFDTYNKILMLLFAVNTHRDTITKEYEVLYELVENWRFNTASPGNFGLLNYSN
jgi:hypothetical protein